MPVLTKVAEPNIWEEICKEYAALKIEDDDNDKSSVSTVYSDFDASKYTPVFFGKVFRRMTPDIDVAADFDPAMSHPACVGYSFAEKPARPLSPEPPAPPDRVTCSPTDFLNHYIYPTLLPALEAMLKQAKVEKCFERKRTKFNACDFLTEYLYSHNPLKKNEDRQDVPLLEIPFVKSWLSNHPRPALPKSLIWTEDEAALKIQSFWLGYKVRKNPEVQELRIWQKEWREELSGIQNRVKEFWEEKMPDDSSSKPGDNDNTSTYKEIIIDTPQDCASPL